MAELILYGEIAQERHVGVLLDPQPSWEVRQEIQKWMDERPGKYSLTFISRSIAAYYFTDPNVAFEFKMRWA